MTGFEFAGPNGAARSVTIKLCDYKLAVPEAACLGATVKFSMPSSVTRTLSCWRKLGVHGMLHTWTTSVSPSHEGSCGCSGRSSSHSNQSLDSSRHWGRRTTHTHTHTTHSMAILQPDAAKVLELRNAVPVEELAEFRVFLCLGRPRSVALTKTSKTHSLCFMTG